jgi:hypothetical protein
VSCTLLQNRQVIEFVYKRDTIFDQEKKMFFTKVQLNALIKICARKKFTSVMHILQSMLTDPLTQFTPWLFVTDEDFVCVVADLEKSETESNAHAILFVSAPNLNPSYVHRMNVVEPRVTKTNITDQDISKLCRELKKHLKCLKDDSIKEMANKLLKQIFQETVELPPTFLDDVGSYSGDNTCDVFFWLQHVLRLEENDVQFPFHVRTWIQSNTVNNI